MHNYNNEKYNKTLEYILEQLKHIAPPSLGRQASEEEHKEQLEYYKYLLIQIERLKNHNVPLATYGRKK